MASLFCAFASAVCPACAQSSSLNALVLYDTAHRLYLDHDYAAAENYARQALQADPEFTDAHELFAHSLFYQKNFKAAVDAYRQTMELNARTHRLSLAHLRLATDNYAAACAMAGNVAQSKSLLKAAIATDPGYPLFYYTLARLYAERGDLENVLANLRAACDRRSKVDPGEEFPDPRTDSTFAKYRHHPRFERMLIEAGY
ncbi:MAG TPA: tetratricopeptide repeat protein [Bryobacteraceae bacterium]|nr:tetratricopeptide repeat protein [Bryobacteraceae bacterium]